MLAPSSVWRTNAAAVSRGSPTSTPASIIASASRNTYAGPGAGEAGDRVELGLGHPHHDPDRAEHALGERELGLARMGAGGDRRGTPADERAGVRHRPHHGMAGSVASMAAIVTPAAIDRISAPSASADADASSAAGTSPGFTATTRISASAAAHAPLGTTRTPGSRSSSNAAAVGVDLGDRDRPGLPAGLHEPGRERLAHPTATQQREVHRGRVTVAVCPLCVPDAVRGQRGRARRPEERSVPHPHFPEWMWPSCTSGLSRRHPSMPGAAI